MGEGCKVSIITVCYNAAKTIENTIKSVIGQTYNNIEYIIIDGGSSDQTIDIIQKYSEHIHYWVSEPDKGIYDAMNKGLKMASGEIIGILNADDYYGEGTVGAAVNRFSLSSGDIVYGDIFLVDSSKEMRRIKPATDVSLLRSKMSIYHPAVFVKKYCYDNYGVFDDTYKISADHELLLRFFVNNVRFDYDANVLVYYRNDGASFKYALVGLKEVRNTSIKYGHKKVDAYFWYYYQVAKLKLLLFYHGIID